MKLDRMHYGAVAVAWVVSMAVGSLWYGPFFSGAWMNATGLTPESLGSPATAMWVMAGCYLVMAWTLGGLVVSTGTRGGWGGAGYGALIGIGLMSANTLTNVFFENRPLSLFWINAGYYLVNFTIMGAILGAWQRRPASAAS